MPLPNSRIMLFEKPLFAAPQMGTNRLFGGIRVVLGKHITGSQMAPAVQTVHRLKYAVHSVKHAQPDEALELPQQGGQSDNATSSNGMRLPVSNAQVIRRWSIQVQQLTLPGLHRAVPHPVHHNRNVLPGIPRPREA